MVYGGEKMHEEERKILRSYLYALCSIERKDNLQRIRKETDSSSGGI